MGGTGPLNIDAACKFDTWLGTNDVHSEISFNVHKSKQCEIGVPFQNSYSIEHILLLAMYYNIFRY